MHEPKLIIFYSLFHMVNAWTNNQRISKREHWVIRICSGASLKESRDYTIFRIIIILQLLSQLVLTLKSSSLARNIWCPWKTSETNLGSHFLIEEVKWRGIYNHFLETIVYGWNESHIKWMDRIVDDLLNKLPFLITRMLLAVNRGIKTIISVKNWKYHSVSYNIQGQTKNVISSEETQF